MPEVVDDTDQIKINDEQSLATITFNFEQLKSSLERKLVKYKEMKMTTENRTLLKSYRAKLNNLDKIFASKITEINEKCMGDLNRKAAIIRDMVKEASKALDVQDKAFEKERVFPLGK